MKLNNKGWGTMEMLLLSGGLLVALLVSVFFIYRLYNSFGSKVSERHYIDLESKLEYAAKEYIDNNHINVNGQYKISYDTLKNEELIGDLKDLDGESCSAYVIVSKINNGITNYKGYLSCKEYQTPTFD